MRFLPCRSSLRAFLSILAFLVLITQAARAKPQGKQWSVDSVPGSKLAGEKVKINLRISPQIVVVAPKKQAALEIPVGAIERIGYDETAHSKGWAFWNAADNPNLRGSGNKDDFIDPFLGFTSVALDAAAAVTGPFKTREHYIRILWQKDGEPQEILLEADKGDYKDILSELQTATGKPWHDLPTERQKLREELDQAKDRKIALQVDREVLVNGTELKPGPYQLVLLERGESQGEAYFFPGSEVHSDHVAAQAVVRVERSAVTQNAEPNASGAGQPEMVFSERASANTLIDLRLPEKTLHFTSPVVSPIAANAARIFGSGGNRWAIVRNTTYKGEPALSFRVLHSAFRPCTEILFVTRTSVAMEPASPSDSHCAALSAPRGEVKAGAPAGIWVVGYLEFKWKEKSYRFQPLFESASGNERIAGIGGQSRTAAHEFGEFFVRAVEDFDAVQRETQASPAPKTDP
jgi:hypothetical protein